MANQHPQTVCINVGAITNKTVAVFKVPDGWGGITILDGYSVMGAAGTSGLALVNLGTGGNTVSATLGTSGTAHGAGTANAFTFSNTFVDDNMYIGVKETNVAAANTVTIVSFSYVYGK